MNYENLLEISNLSYYKNGKYFLEGISFNIKRQDLITIVGKNGAGKSTLCKAIVGSIKASGQVVKAKDLKISYVPQINLHNTLVPLRVSDFIFLNNKKTLSIDDNHLIEIFGVEKLFNFQFKHLSGGEKQKVILLRALLKQPSLLILDEPISFVDFASKDIFYNIINDYRKKYNLAVLMISHDLNLVLKNSTWILCLNQGRIGCSGTIESIHQQDVFNAVLGDNYAYYQHKDGM